MNDSYITQKVALYLDNKIQDPMMPGLIPSHGSDNNKTLNNYIFHNLFGLVIPLELVQTK